MQEPSVSDQAMSQAVILAQFHVAWGERVHAGKWGNSALQQSQFSAVGRIRFWRCIYLIGLFTVDTVYFLVK